MAETGRFARLPAATRGLTIRPDTRSARRELGLTSVVRRGVQRALYESHAVAARQLQQMVADELATRRTRRPRRAEGALTESILDARNRDVSASGFQVGVEEWLFSASPAARYARRIEMGGPNPMSALGPIRGAFFIPGGPYAPHSGMAGRHGRLYWVPGLVSTTSSTGRSGRAIPKKGAFTVKANDVVAAAGGYHLHERAGEKFVARDRMYDIYAEHLRRHVPDWVQLGRA